MTQPSPRGGASNQAQRIFFFLPLSHAKWGRYNMFFFIMLWLRFGNYFYDRPLAWRQPSLKLEWVLTIANATGTNGLTCLPNQAQRIIVQNSWNQTSNSYINSSIKLNLNQSANVNLKPLKWYVFWIYVMLFQRSDTFHK
jgi:hypothetical protein